MNDQPKIIIDLGTAYTKAGLSTHLKPLVLGSEGGYQIQDGHPQYQFGSAFASRAQYLRPVAPLSNGEIDNVEATVALLEYILQDELPTPASTVYPMILAERPYANHRMREELCEIMFECFHTPKLNISCQPILALYAQGTYSGLVVDVGHGKTSVTPVIAGCPIQQGMSQTKFAGQLLESLLSDYLRQDNHLRHIKEANCRVPPLTGRPDENAVGNFQLPDGTSIRMTQEAQNLGEVLFRKSDLPDFDTFLGLQSMVWNGIRHAPMDSRMIMAENIILVGGTTQLPGFADRLLEEVKLNVPEGMKAKLCVHQAKGAPPSKLDDAKKPAQVSAQVLPSLTAVWQGGRVLAGFNDSQSLWLNQDEYYEAGKGAIHKKTTM